MHLSDLYPPTLVDTRDGRHGTAKRKDRQGRVLFAFRAPGGHLDYQWMAAEDLELNAESAAYVGPKGFQLGW